MCTQALSVVTERFKLHEGYDMMHSIKKMNFEQTHDMSEKDYKSVPLKPDSGVFDCGQNLILVHDIIVKMFRIKIHEF